MAIDQKPITDYQKSLEDGGDAKKQKHRSPAYPSIGLKDAVDKVRLIWNHEKRNEVSVDVVAEHWKMAAKSSSTLLAVSALKKFGLITDRGSGDQRYVKLTDLAYNILRADLGTGEWLKWIQKAALSPKVIAELWETDKENPKSTPNLKKYLEFEKKFNPLAIDQFIQTYRDTISFAKLGIGDKAKTEESHGIDNQPENENLGDGAENQAIADPAEKSKKNYDVDTTINLGEIAIPVAGKFARIPYPMSEDDFELFEGTLRLWKKKLVRKLTAIPPLIKLPASAVWKNNDTDKPVKIVAVMGDRDGVLYYQSDDGTGIPASQLKF